MQQVFATPTTQVTLNTETAKTIEGALGSLVFSDSQHVDPEKCAQLALKIAQNRGAPLLTQEEIALCRKACSDRLRSKLLPSESPEQVRTALATLRC